MTHAIEREQLHEIDMMRMRREAAELDISAAHREMTNAVCRYYKDGKNFRHPVHLCRWQQRQLASIRDWANELLRRAEENSEHHK